MKQEVLIAYSMSFSSYILENIDGIRSIVLFGSVARGKFDTESDIDIFIDVQNLTKQKEKEIKIIASQFFETETYKKWKLKGVDLEISPIIGDLKSSEWESLYLSVCSEGIQLYGKYQSSPENLKHYVIFSYSKIKNNKKRINVYRKLFGYVVGGKKYQGLVKKINGRKIGSGVFLVPIEDSKKVRKMFEDLNIQIQMCEVWMLENIRRKENESD